MTVWKEKTRLFKLYHIRVKGNYDLQEGYIGITRGSLTHRFSQHLTSKRPIGEILRSPLINSIEIIELGRYPKFEALQKEYKLRPKMNIGWNVMAGGGEATVRCPECNKYLPKRKQGSYCMSCRNTRFTVGHTPHNYGKGEKFKLTDPKGNTYFPEAFTVFCRNNNLTPQNLRLVAKGKRKHHKGWIASKIA